MFEEADLIHRYSRADAIADGVLVDVTGTAREAGIRYPVALTAAAWERCVAVPPGVACQDEAGRLWDVLWLLRCAIGRSNGTEVRFGVHVRNHNREGIPPLVRLEAVCGPGDQGEPVVTVMPPEEDWRHGSARPPGGWPSCSPGEPVVRPRGPGVASRALFADNNPRLPARQGALPVGTPRR
jgi:hypothetical protein